MQLEMIKQDQQSRIARFKAQEQLDFAEISGYLEMIEEDRFHYEVLFVLAVYHYPAVALSTYDSAFQKTTLKFIR